MTDAETAPRYAKQEAYRRRNMERYRAWAMLRKRSREIEEARPPWMPPLPIVPARLRELPTDELEARERWAERVEWSRSVRWGTYGERNARRDTLSWRIGLDRVEFVEAFGCMPPIPGLARRVRPWRAFGGVPYPGGWSAAPLARLRHSPLEWTVRRASSTD